eukprot:gene25006-biopygen2965
MEPGGRRRTPWGLRGFPGGRAAPLRPQRFPGARFRGHRSVVAGLSKEMLDHFRRSIKKEHQPTGARGSTLPRGHTPTSMTTKSGGVAQAPKGPRRQRRRRRRAASCGAAEEGGRGGGGGAPGRASRTSRGRNGSGRGPDAGHTVDFKETGAGRTRQRRFSHTGPFHPLPPGSSKKKAGRRPSEQCIESTKAETRTASQQSNFPGCSSRRSCSFAGTLVLPLIALEKYSAVQGASPGRNGRRDILGAFVSSIVQDDVSPPEATPGSFGAGPPPLDPGVHIPGTVGCAFKVPSVCFQPRTLQNKKKAMGRRRRWPGNFNDNGKMRRQR